MPRYVSVPEKTLEHWTSQYINNRFRWFAEWMVAMTTGKWPLYWTRN